MTVSVLVAVHVSQGRLCLDRVLRSRTVRDVLLRLHDRQFLLVLLPPACQEVVGLLQKVEVPEGPPLRLNLKLRLGSDRVEDLLVSGRDVEFQQGDAVLRVGSGSLHFVVDVVTYPPALH